MWKFTGRERPEFAEKPGPKQESVWDYPRPPLIVEDAREVIVQYDGKVIAKSNKTLRILETASPPTFYLPPNDVDKTLLQRAAGSSSCEWKGRATYWNVVVSNKVLNNAGWSYECPTDRFSAIAGYLSFYPAVVRCTVNGELVLPQPGGFYGGWVTSEIIGPIKGAPGTEGW